MKTDDTDKNFCFREAFKPSVFIGVTPCGLIIGFPFEPPFNDSEITPARRFAPTSPIEGEVNFMRGSNNLPPR